MKKNRKIGLAALAVSLVISLILISFQSDTKSLTTLGNNFNTFDISENRYGTINTSIGSPVLGSPDAPLTIFVFGDYQCNECRYWFLNIKPNIMKNFIETEKVNMVFIDTELLGKDSLKASEATYCAEEQGKYWEFQQILFTNQQELNSGWANSENLTTFASDLELDMDFFVSCLDSGKYEKKVKFNAYEAKKNGVSKTPTFVIVNSQGGHHIIKGSATYSTFEQVIGFLTL